MCAAHSAQTSSTRCRGAKDLVAACDPLEMTVDLIQQVRGGLQIRTVVRYPSSQPDS